MKDKLTFRTQIQMHKLLKRLGFKQGRVGYVWFRERDNMMAAYGGPNWDTLLVYFWVKSKSNAVSKRRS